jgi:multicomponent Na+:H+ antiporter subunit F
MKEIMAWAIAFSPTGIEVILWISIALSLYRLLRGPSMADRVVALDLVAMLTVGLIVHHAIFSGQPVYLRAAIVVGLVAYMGTVAFAYFIEKGGRP